MGGFSLWHWLVVLVIVVLVFGTKRLKNVGQDLGEAVRGFKKGLHEDDAAPLTSILKPLKVVPETMNVENLMTQLMQERQHMCLVYDEFGSWRGLVTLEDIMETIIGKPILDETDDIPNMRRFAKRRWEHRIKAIREE